MKSYMFANNSRTNRMRSVCARANSGARIGGNTFTKSKIAKSHVAHQDAYIAVPAQPIIQPVIFAYPYAPVAFTGTFVPTLLLLVVLALAVSHAIFVKIRDWLDKE